MDDTPHLRPINQFLQRLAGSSNKSSLSTNLSAKTDAATAVARAQLLAGCYRKDDAADPATYAAAVSAVLAEYAPDIVQRVTDPRSGLPSRSQWLPTVKEVRDACEDLAWRQQETAAAVAREQQQLRERRQWLASQERRPTLDELKAKHGENWGLKADVKAEETARAQRRKSLQIDANRTVFERECAAAGMPANSTVSPGLASLIEEWREITANYRREEVA